MGRRTTEPTQPASPYEMHKGTPLWEAVNDAIAEVVDNDDLSEKTPRDYIVGYICEKLHDIGDTQSLRSKG